MSLIKVFLDDKRVPAEMATFGKRHNSIYATDGWLTLTSYEMFEKYIRESVIPDIISFDHDLCDEHNRAIPKLDKMTNSTLLAIEMSVYDKFVFKCGYHAAKWLVTYCVMNGYDLPLCFVHAANDNAVRNILGALDMYELRKSSAKQMQEYADSCNGNFCGC